MSYNNLLSNLLVICCYVCLQDCIELLYSELYDHCHGNEAILAFALKEYQYFNDISVLL